MMEKVIGFIHLKKVILMVFVLIAIIFAVPSMKYLSENGTIRNFNEYFKFCLDDTNRIEQTIIYLIILTLLTICYFLIVKNREKLFKNNKQMYMYIAIISLIFVIYSHHFTNLCNGCTLPKFRCILLFRCRKIR